MKRISLHISATVILLMLVLTISLAVPQAGNSRPLTWEQVLEYWKAEAAETLRKNITRERIVQNGVAFALDDARERELVRLKMSPDLITEIKRQNRMATLIIECDPDCAVAVNNESAGRTTAQQLRTSVLAGSVDLEVSAPPTYKPVKEALKIAPGDVVRRSFKLEPVRGALQLECMPDCMALVTGPGGYKRSFSTVKNHGTLDELPDGEYTVNVEADGFTAASSRFVVRAPNTANATFKLVVDEWAGKSAVDVVELMTEKVGPLQLVHYSITAKSDGQMRITGDQSIGDWSAELSESSVPNKLRWEMRITGRRWNVAFDGTTARSDGDRRFGGTELARELEQSIRLVTALRLPAALMKIRQGFELRKGRVNGAPVLVASSEAERYTFHLDENFVPRKLLHERLITPRSQAEAEYGLYREVMPGLRLPHMIIFRYPDRPKHEQLFEFKTVDPGLALRDSFFARP